ncbi:hypothetical protein ABEB36_000720 [Hypothenemus hampei]|uniref:Uncharacterized protein n=1 Tax=Hypothenemus hampei TaxID=57062 RepID=A0ABD1FC73_HYPHA
MTGEEITNTEDYLAMATYLTQVYDTFRGEIPHIKHPKLNVSESLIKSSKLPDENPQLLNIIKRKNSNSADILFTKGGKRVENLKDLLSNNKLKTRTESENRLKEKKPVRKSSSHERPSKVLSEKTFLTTSIKSLKSLEKEFSSHRRSKGDFFDLTYHDDSLDRIPLKKSQKTQIGVDEKRVKKVKSRNVSLYVNLGDVNSASKRKPKVKNSNLSVIPEYIEEKCSENMKNISEEKNNRVKSAPKVQDASVNFGSSVRLFSCETFIQNSYDSHSPPIVASATEQPKEKSIVKLPQGQYFLNNNIGQQKSVISNIARDSGAPLDKLKQTENRFIYGLRNYSPLQIIRRHLLMKKKQLGLILSKQKIVPPFISEVKLPSNISSTTNEEVKTKSTHSSSNESIKIQLIHKSSSNKITCQNIEYKSSRNLVKITSKIPGDFVTNSNSRLIILTDNSQSTKRSNYMEKSYFHGGSGGGEKKIEQIFENKENFLRRNISLAGSMRNDFLPKLQLPKLPDFREKTKKRLQVKKKPSMSCVDKQIINSLGANETSTLKSKRAPRDDHFKKKINFLFQTGIRKTRNCHESLPCDSKKLKMDFFEENHNFTPLVYSRVQNWISQHDFNPDEVKQDTEGTSILSDITSITRAHLNKTGEYDDVKVEQRTYVVKCESSAESSHEDLAELVKTLKDGKSKAIFKDNKSKCKKPLSKFNLKSVSAPPGNFSVITEGEEGSELPENTNQSEFSFKSIKTSNHQLLNTNVVLSSRPSSRHRRHAEGILPKSSSIDKKQRKRRTLERIGPSVEERQRTLEEIAANRTDRQNKRKQQRQRQTEQFIKSMQMLQANCKSDRSEPFEDYSIFLYRQTAPKFEDRVKDLEKQFTYIPDYDSKTGGLKPLANTNAEDDIASKIKHLEDKWTNRQPTEKKPKDLMRAIGKIETSDWNIQQIEKKILENKAGKPSTLNVDKERVPRWSKEEFRARQTKMEKKHLDKQDNAEAKYADIDRNIKQLDLKLKEGTNRELGQNKVASITEKLSSKAPTDKPIEKPIQPKPVNLPLQTGSEFCHFCKKRVYLMERLSAEGRFFHHGCFKCQYCHTQLRLGSYMFDRDGQYGFRFFCVHHYGMQGELPRPVKVTRKPSQKGSRESGRSPQKKALSGVAGVDLLDRVQTPERIEFANLSTGNISSDHDEPLSQMDEDEWTDKNFGASCNELDESEDDDSSSISDTDSDDEDAFDDALEQPITKEGTMKWAERLKNSYRKSRHSESDAYSSSDHSSYYENSSDDSESETATEGEEEIRARELRRKEVQVEPPVVQTDTGTDTEVKRSLNILPVETVPDILNDHSRLDPNKTPSPLSKSASNYSINSEIFNSAESDLDFNMNKTSSSAHCPNVVVGKLTLTAPKNDSSKPPPKSGPLSKSATAGNIAASKIKRNFVLPPKEQRRNFGQEFKPKFKLEEPLLVIRRTPSKVNLPKEIKPKVAVNTKVIDTKKYFGAPNKPPVKPKVTKTRAPLVKQKSLPETNEEIKEANTKSFNFDLKDSDLEDIDTYIEDLLTKEEELLKPIDPSKFAIKSPQEKEDEPISSSIEDLFHALEKTTEAPSRELQKESDEKIEDLLKWMEELDHQTPDRKVYRSVSDAKYKNLENLLRKPQKRDSVISKLPRNNVAFFEAILKGRAIPKDSSSDENLHQSKGGLSRSKTEVHFNRSKIPRTSVDLDAVSNVNIKSVLKKFESMDQEDEEQQFKPKKPVKKRFSLGQESKKKISAIKPKPIDGTIKKFESDPKLEKPFTESRRSSLVKNKELSFEETIKDLEKFVDDTIESIGKNSHPKSNGLDKSKSDWCVNVSVSSKVSPEYLKLQEAQKKANAARTEPAQMDFAKELNDFQAAISAFNQDDANSSISEQIVEPHNFSKAVESSDSSDDASQANMKSQLKAVDDLYAKVNKPKKNVLYSPPVPRRRKHSQSGPPQPPTRVAKQKSLNNENLLPVVPQRKRSSTASPLVKRKNEDLKPLDNNARSTSTSNLEMVSDESSSESSSQVQNSATEISTDSEFAQDDPTPTREVPSIALNDFYVTKTRGSGKANYPRRIQVTSGFIQKPLNDKASSKPNPNIELKLSPLVASSTPSFKKPAPISLARTEGYALNRTQSTGGIAAKVSLELKKKYLLGESGTNSIQKSGSASTLDTKFKSFQNTISDCQKLLKPASEISPSMQVFCNKLDERHSPVSPQGTFMFSGYKNASEPSKPLPPPDITITTIAENKEEKSSSEFRPRSPIHEASIPVPAIDWSKQNKSQSSDSLSLSESEHEAPKTTFDIPRVEVKESSDREEGLLLDSLCEINKTSTSDKKSLNQPKSLPNLETVLPDIHKALHVKLAKEDSPEDNKSVKTISGKSSPEGTAALTETELSDWARDENVSDSIELDISQTSEGKKFLSDAVNHHVCGKDSKEVVNKTILTDAISNALSGNLENIEYMDTGTETSSEDGIVDSQNGYVLFKDEEDLAEDSLNPRINEVFEAKNIALVSKETSGDIQRNTGYCEIVKEPSFGSAVVDLKPADLEKLKQRQTFTDHEEDSLIIIETGTTTEENTSRSDSTVKNITEICSSMLNGKDKPSLKLENLQKSRLEERLAKVKAEQTLLKEQKEKENIENNLQYEEHCQRLQSKIDFGNARDSIDIRKSRRKSKSETPQKPDLIQEEKERTSPPRNITLNLTPVRPDVLYKKENIKKERDVNKKLIEEMVMNKMKAENKSLERKKRNRNLSSLSPNRPFNVPKCSTSEVVRQTNLNNLGLNNPQPTPDLLTSSLVTNPNVDPINKKSLTSMTYTPKQTSNRPLSVFSTFTDVRKLPETPLTNPENFSMPDIRKNLFGEDLKIPRAPPRYNRPSDVAKTVERIKDAARARARLLSNEDLGLSPDDKFNKLREKVGDRKADLDMHVQESIESLVLNTERRNSLLYSNDTLTKKRNNSFKRSRSGGDEVAGIRPKSISEIPKNLSVSHHVNREDGNKKICKSDPNLLETSTKGKKKGKDRERKKSITKLIAGIFTKKSPTTVGLFTKFSPKSKSKSLTSLDSCKHETVVEPRKTVSEVTIKTRELTPPPIPPLPKDYSIKATDESSDGEMIDDKQQIRSSCDTLDQSGNVEAPLSGRRSGKARRLSRQAQLKRHRMAQEIQRKLEETEVKTRELEQRGVEVEKMLRGEDGGNCVRDESELLQEWFDLMRDKTELRRYEKELMVRAQELELEDRHSRLQLELRERLESNENKTDEDLKAEENIIQQMMDIVAKRDSLIAVLEEDRLRYSHEDKDLEEQMLAKGLMLTPILKTPEK